MVACRSQKLAQAIYAPMPAMTGPIHAALWDFPEFADARNLLPNGSVTLLLQLSEEGDDLYLASLEVTPTREFIPRVRNFRINFPRL